MVLGGLITIPAAFMFLGACRSWQNPPGTFGMGFVTAAQRVQSDARWATSSGSCSSSCCSWPRSPVRCRCSNRPSPCSRKGLGIGRKASVAMLGFITAVRRHVHRLLLARACWPWTRSTSGSATFCIYMMATFQVDPVRLGAGHRTRAWTNSTAGPKSACPGFVGLIIKYVSPVYLLVIFVPSGSTSNLPERIVPSACSGRCRDRRSSALSLGLIVLVIVFFPLIINRAVSRWESGTAAQTEVSP